MKNIIIGFSKAKNPWAIGSKIIQMTEKRNFSHTYIRYECPTTNISLIAHAAHGFVSSVNFDIFKQRNVVVDEYAFDIEEKDFQSILLYINKNLGVPYSLMQLVLISIKKLFKIELNVHNKNQAFICSEFIGQICEILKLIPNTKNQDYLTPSDLNKLLKMK